MNFPRNRNLFSMKTKTNDPSPLLQIFDFESHTVRVITRDEAPWFVAADVCRALNLADVTSACRGLEDDERMTLHNERSHSGQRGGAQFFNVISESGLYALIFTSRKPEARRFRKWVTAEVLPALRQEGAYRVEEAVMKTGRGQLSRLREILLGTMEGVVAGSLTPGKAQAVAIAAQRYLETVKLEGEAIGYENVFDLSNDEAGVRLLPSEQERADALLQGLSQQEMRGAAEGEAALSEEATSQQEAVE
jgi:prophage antirepressor-like protein